MLTEVHRQARNDPIVRLSMEIRAGNRLEPGDYGETQVVRRDALDPQRVLDADQVLVGRNATRRAYNSRMRERRGFAERAADGGRQARLPAQQPAQGAVQRRALDGEGAAESRAAASLACGCSPKTRPARAPSRSRSGRNASPARSSRSSGRSASDTTNSTSATCSPCTRRKARNGTTWCCSTSASRSPTAATAGSTPA